MAKSIVIDFPQGAPTDPHILEDVAIGLKYLLNATVPGMAEVNIRDTCTELISERDTTSTLPWYLYEIPDEDTAARHASITGNYNLCMLFPVLQRQGVHLFSVISAKCGQHTGFHLSVLPGGGVKYIVGRNGTAPDTKQLSAIQSLITKQGWTLLRGAVYHNEVYEFKSVAPHVSGYDETELGNQVVDFLSITFAMMGAAIRGFRSDDHWPNAKRSGLCWRSSSSHLTKSEIRLCDNIVRSALLLYPDIAALTEDSVVYDDRTFSVDNDTPYVQIFLFWKNSAVDAWLSKISDDGYPL